MFVSIASLIYSNLSLIVFSIKCLSVHWNLISRISSNFCLRIALVELVFAPFRLVLTMTFPKQQPTRLHTSCFIEMISGNVELATWLLEHFLVHFRKMMQCIQVAPLLEPLERIRSRKIPFGSTIDKLHFWINLDPITIQDCKADDDALFVMSLYQLEDQEYCRRLAFLLNIADKDIEQIIETYIQKKFYDVILYLEDFLNNSHKRRKT